MVADGAVWTSDVNNNDKPDLNEAFFIRRERAPDNPMRMTGRRFTGPNVWPDEDVLPGFRSHVLDYLRAMEDFTNRLLPAVSVSLDLDPGFFTPHFVESQFTPFCGCQTITPSRSRPTPTSSASRPIATPIS